MRRQFLTALGLLALLCTISWAEPTAKAKLADSYTPPAPGQWFDLAIKIDPKGASIAAEGLTVEGALDGAEFDAMILPPPDAEGAFTNAFTARLPVKIAAGRRHTIALTVTGTADGKPFTIETKRKVNLNDQAKRHVEAFAKLRDPAATGKANAIVVSGAVVEAGFHVYGAQVNPEEAIAVFAGVLPAPGARTVTFQAPQKTSPDGKKLQEFTFEIPFTPVAGGKQLVRVRLEWQACTDEICDTNEFVYLPLSYEAKGEDVAVPVAEVSSGGADKDLAKKGFLELAILAIFGGLFALAMPCTYPMIPITISFFTKQSETREGQTKGLAFAYGAGIVAIFTLVGVLFGPPIIAFATLWWVNAIFALLFLVFGLSLIGLFDISLPGWMNDLAYKISPPGGEETQSGLMGHVVAYLSVFAMGTTLVITSFTCTAPIIGLVLVLAAEGGSLDKVAFTMAVFGLTMAIPFVLLSLAPNAMKKMPRSGEWMKTLKVTLGIVELGLVLKFVSNMDLAFGTYLISRELFLVLWGVSFLVAGLYLLNLTRFFVGGQKWSLGWIQGLCGALLLALTFYLYSGAKGKLLFPELEAFLPTLPDREQTYTEAFAAVVKEDFEAGVKKATELGVPIFLDFTGFQ